MGRYANRQLQFRIGNKNAAGGRPVHEQSRTLRTVTASQWQTPITLAGAGGSLNLGQLGTPASFENTTFTELGTANNHPSEHPQMVAAGWSQGVVLSSMYRLDVRMTGTDSAGKDFVVAHKFAQDSNSIITFTAGATVIDLWKDMRQSRGWSWKRFSGINAGGSIYPSQGRIEIKVPDCPALTRKLNEPASSESMDWPNDFKMIVQDGADVPNVSSFLHIVIFFIDGTVGVAGDIKMDLTVFQKIKLWNPINIEDMIDEADQVS